MMVSKEYWKIGELANQTGLTVRALHHYDHKGLLHPSDSSESGHRLYTKEDIAKLQQVVSLKQMGFSLEQIKSLMESDTYNALEVLRIQMERLEEHIRSQEQLHDRLQKIYVLLSNRKEVTTDLFMKTIEVMNVDTSKYFTAEQLEKLKQQGELLGQEKIREVENEWPSLIARVREENDKGTPVDDPEVLKLAKRWKELMNLFSGGDPELIKAAGRFHAENPGNALQNGLDSEMFQYISKAMAHL
jgi:MerR family transcriptional regulator, thiopeptide resistance regulator